MDQKNCRFKNGFCKVDVLKNFYRLFDIIYYMVFCLSVDGFLCFVMMLIIKYVFLDILF